MPDTTAQIESRIREFVAELHVLIRNAAVDAVTTALGGAAPVKRGPGRPRKTSALRISATPALKTASKSSHRNVGGVRTPAVVAKTIERARDYIAAHAGHGVEKIGPAVGATTGQLALPIKKLLASKHVVRKGVRRATRYFPGPNVTGVLPAPSLGGRPKTS